jgi:drug/metabolite transporter (DMT)-like permease
MSKPPISPYLAVFVGVIAVSFSSLFVRLATAPALIIATYRLLFTFLVLAPFSFRKRADLRAMGGKRLLLTATGGLFLALHFVIWFISLNYTSVASSVVLVTTQPIFVVLGSLLFFKERISRLALLGGGLAITGSVIIGAADFQVGLRALFGDMLALVAAVMISGYLLIGRRLRKDVPLEAFTAVTYGTSTLALVITALITRTPFSGYPPRDWLLFVALALVCTVMGHTLFSWALRHVPASAVSVSILGEPLGAILWAGIFLGEPPTLRQIIGGGVIFSGLYLFTWVSAHTPQPAS